MKYFVDFEATQFSNEIIEIGCVREDGAEFKSYVNAKRKLTDFIKNLTGISQETIDAAPSSDEVFRNFYQWLKGALGWLRTHQRLIRKAAGVLMIAYGFYLIIW